MGVGKDDKVDILGLDHGVAVVGIGFQALTLEHAAVQKDVLSFFSGNQVFAAGDFLGSADKLYFHALFNYSTTILWVVTPWLV